MRWIDKTGPPPTALEEYLEIQRPTGVNLDYDSFTRKPQLRRELTAQQFGLCALTGTAVDDRLGTLAADGHVTTKSGGHLKIKAHNAHLKPQKLCKQEMIARREVPGHAVGEDMDYRNIVAAILVEGAPDERFGAAAQEDKLLRLKPTDQGCETRFYFDSNGDVRGVDADASDTVDILKLDHRTLSGWRRETIDVFTDPEFIRSPADWDAIIAAMDTPVNGQLPPYCFAIKQVVMRLRPQA